MDERAQISLTDVIFTLMITIIGMTALGLTIFPFVDIFMQEITSIDIPLSIWGQGMMDNLVIRYSTWIFIVPGFFCLLMFVWAFKTIIKKHEYTAQDQFMTDEFN